MNICEWRTQFRSDVCRFYWQIKQTIEITGITRDAPAGKIPPTLLFRVPCQKAAERDLIMPPLFVIGYITRLFNKRTAVVGSAGLLKSIKSYYYLLKCYFMLHNNR